MKTTRLAAAAFALLVLLGAVALNNWLIDGLSGEFWGLLFDEDTRYAPSYSDAAWRRSHVGETVPDVIRDLGAPLEVLTNDDSSLTMRWSISPADTHYRTRAMIVRDGRIVGKWAEFYID